MSSDVNFQHKHCWLRHIIRMLYNRKGDLMIRGRRGVTVAIPIQQLLQINFVDHKLSFSFSLLFLESINAKFV